MPPDQRHALATPLTSALRALLFLPLSRHGTVPRWPLLVVLALGLMTSLVQGYVYGDGTLFNDYALPIWLFLPFVLLLIGLWCDRRAQPDMGWMMFGLLLAAGIWIGWLYAGVYELARLFLSRQLMEWFGFVGYFVASGWLGLAVGIGAVRGIGWVRWRGLLFALGIALIVLALQAWLVDAPRLLYPDYSAERDEIRPPPPKLAGEDAFYGETYLLDDALDAITAGKPGVPEVFTIALGGDAEQAVFLREARSFDTLFQQRFATPGHTILLANHDSATGKIPIATQTSLSAALQRIGQQMNKDEDVLVLYMTSHGGRTHDFLIDNAPLELNQITPQWLAAAIREAGIRWRVVVVSACYSGGYIAPLMAEDALVATAADATHTSFGCADENDFTYYGHALHDALRSHADWLPAFEAARVAVSERERREQIEPSHPQLFVGAAIAGKLVSWRAH
ncbi:hypothetical protein IGB42_02864 [Andreprevotia sp. IGB-42]|uniref:C13 family peptidase n=1 Tax=Andreprevotia sp. IGB-42 TaxID=2497473 RepID=UPI00135BFE6E|nr:C13 family peptidase [Andreprevotia sp. IGB-42]KAF0812575.1 hypothetical protein IGB42_02864 [Andreprevotia sp. IGB-42]